MLRLLPVVFLVACSTPLVISAGSEELAVPERLAFPRTALGSSRVVSLTAVNRSKLEVTANLVTSGPFSAPTTLELGGGQEATLDVRFSPTTAGPHTGELTIEGFGTVFLEGEGVEPLRCGAGSPCLERVFDPETMSCVEQLAPEGERCSDEQACIERGACRAGTCVGVASTCDDTNPCTDDACAVGVGCTHAPRVCVAPANPCLAAVCDPRTGCGAAPVVDGTPCGAVSCVLANVCLSGQCRAVEPPEGFRCSEPTACRGEGVCRQKQCVEPPPHELLPRWTYQPTNPSVVFEGLSDERGNWYWLECTPSPNKPLPAQHHCFAISRTNDGFERFRSPVSAVVKDTPAGAKQLLSSGHFIFTTGAEVIAVSTETGAERWRRQRVSNETPFALADDGHGDVWVAVRSDDARTTSWLLLRLEVATGRLVAQSPPFERAIQRLVSDVRGRAFIGLYSGNPQPDERTPPHLVRVERDGGVGLNVMLNASVGPVMVVGQTVVLDDDSARDAEDGGLLQVASSLDTRATGGVSTGAMRVRIGKDPVTLDVDPPMVHLERNDGGVRAATAVTAYRSSPAYLTRNNEVLVATALGRTTHARVFSEAGTEQWSCRLRAPPDQSLLDGLTGFNGRTFAIESFCETCFWAAPTWHFFDVGHLGSAPNGWVGPRGTLGGSNRAK